MDEKSFFEKQQESLRATVANADATRLGVVLRIVNALTGVFLFLAAVLYFLKGDIEAIIGTVYVMFLSSMMVLNELRISFIQAAISRNFGFMFNASGRSLFIIFISTLSLSFDKVGIAAGVIGFLVVFFNIYVLTVNKSVSVEIQDAYNPPDLNTHLADEGPSASVQASKFMIDNPEVARQAADFARENPELARKAANAAANNV